MVLALAGKKVAVVGSGVSGLSSAWLLHYHGARVTLYERECSCGGHTLTDTSAGFPVDLGFQVYNLTTYPHLIGLLEQLQVDTEPSNMSFSLSMDGGRLEWASHGLNTIFAQRKNLASPAFLRMVWDVIRFGRQAPQVLQDDKFRSVTLGEYLQAKRYSAGFRDNYVVPMCAAVWSVPGATVMAFPVQMLVRFWVNHHLLDILERPLWRVVKNRSVSYVNEIVSVLDDVRVGTEVTAVTATSGDEGAAQVQVMHLGGTDRFDFAVLAVHSDIALKLRGSDVTDAEKAVLEAIPYNANDIYLHTDLALMPKSKACWASWNFIGTSDRSRDTSAVCVSYWANLLQDLPPDAPETFVTLNPPKPPAPDKTFRRLSLAHPVYSFDSWHAQEKVPDIQGSKGCLYYAGAWCGYGFHEDGMRASVAVMHALGLPLPWVPRPTKPHSSLGDMYCLRCLTHYLRKGITRGSLRLVLPSGYDVTVSGPAENSESLALGSVPCYDVPQPHPVGSVTTHARSMILNIEQLQHFGAAAHGPARVRLNATVRVISNAAVNRVVQYGSAGLVQAYANREVEVSDVGGFAAVLAANATGLTRHSNCLGLLHTMRMKMLLAHEIAAGTSIDATYCAMETLLDAFGTPFFRLFLDENLHLTPALHGGTQSSRSRGEAHAAFDELVLSSSAFTLREQANVLQIGCGWGALACAGAARCSGTWTATVLSKHQFEYVSLLCSTAGADNGAANGDTRRRPELCYGDWREVVCRLRHNSLDSVVCVDPTVVATLQASQLLLWFASLSDVLKPGGMLTMLAFHCAPGLVQEAEENTTNFVRQQLLACASMPSYDKLLADAAEAGLVLGGDNGDSKGAAGERVLSADWAATLREWRYRLEAEWHNARLCGTRDYDIRRMEMSLALLEALFETGSLQCSLLTWTKDAQQCSPTGAGVQDSVRERMKHHASVAKPVSTELLAWLQCVLLMGLGVLLNWLFGHLKGTV